MSSVSRLLGQFAASGVGKAIRTFEQKVPGMSTRQVEDHLTQNTQLLAAQMSQYAQRGQKVPADLIAVAVATGYYAAELRNREQQHRT